MIQLIAIFIGGGLGSITRFGFSSIITSRFHGINPMATLVSNFISTLILGVVLFVLTEKFDLGNTWKALLVIGFCGGFSTFSTFSYETFELLKNGHYWFAIFNVLISVGMILAVLFLLYKNFAK